MKRLFITALAAIILLAGCADAGGEDHKKSGAEKTYRQVSQKEAMELMDSEENYIILDVRTREEFDEKHIPGAICLPNETIGDADIPELPDKDQLILIYCRSGNRSKQAAEKLFNKGYTNIVEFGGINTWTGETVGSQN